MFPEFFVHKVKEALSFFHILKGRATRDNKVRRKGVEEALRSLDKEREVYLREKREASRGEDSDVPARNKKGQADGPGRDISAI